MKTIFTRKSIITFIFISLNFVGLSFAHAKSYAKCNGEGEKVTYFHCCDRPQYWGSAL